MLISGEAGPYAKFYNKSACTLPEVICQVLALPRLWELIFVLVLVRCDEARPGKDGLAQGTDP